MGGFCLLWDRANAWDERRLRRLGTAALDRLSHRFAPGRSESAGPGWWLGLCRGTGGPPLTLASDAGAAAFLVLDGWLENHAELAATLGGPRDWAPVEDAELVLALCLREGPEALGRLRGPMVAILWEPGVPRLTAVRDHLGEAALCFAEGQGPLALSSQEQALFGHPGVSRAPDLGWLARFCVRHPPPPGRTALRDIAELAPGEQGQWPASGLRRHRPRPGFQTGLRWPLSHADAVAEWRQALELGLGSAMRRGRRFGAMLSGGMDSTTAVALAAPAIRSSGRGLKAYSWRLMRHPQGDEGARIEATARHMGIDVHWVPGDGCLPRVDPDTWPPCPNLPQLNPFLGLNLAVYEAARSDGCDVLINGHLGDSLYPHQAHVLADAIVLRDPRQAYRELARVLRREGPLRWAGAPEIRALVKRLPGLGWLPRRPPRCLTRAAAQWYGETAPWPPEKDQVPHPSRWVALFGTASAMELKYERYFCERAGVERRHPLRHWRILATLLGLPSFLFFDDDRAKLLTRQAMRGSLPDLICETTGGGDLNSLFLEGFFGEGRDALRALLEGPGCLWPELIRRDYLIGALALGRQASVQQQRVLVSCAGIELWRLALESA